MKAFYSSAHLKHRPASFFYWGNYVPHVPDIPERAELILAALDKAGHTILEAPDYGMRPIADVHTPEYLEFLECAWREFQAEAQAGSRWPELIGKDVAPLMFPVRGVDKVYPKSILGRAGCHAIDMWMPIGEHTWAAATASANLAVAAADTVLGGERMAYAMCRPSGHHVYPDKGGGNCFLNNAAIAAQFLRRKLPRVAILDVDVHHGNGTQGIFYERNDVLTVSIHADPGSFYPYFVGYEPERGEGVGHGFNTNIVLPRFATDDVYLPGLEAACKRISTYAPDALVVSLGVDGHEADRSNGMRLSYDCFRRIGARLTALGLPTVIVQEGGYNMETIGTCVSEAIAGFSEG